MDEYAVEKSLPYYDQIYQSIREMIFNGVFKPGERVYEAKIAREFNVSRSPVREAVKILEKEGLLVVDDKSRISVFNPTVKDFEEIYQCRIVLESLATQLTTRLATQEQLSEIENVIVQTRKYLEKEDHNRESIIDLNAEFHELITRYSQNSRLQKQLYDLRSLSHYYRVMNFKGDKREWTLYKEHEEILNFMLARDAEKASAAMAKHITNDLLHFKKITSSLDNTTLLNIKGIMGS
ncbi:GntR family transcriptional regulator [Ammoniphilus sp. 3BR4]|uniref:GntR family transcriptional regulator n=1 Tax=Ammoniphilus sp. 3BR4 TaxID=3158265 RepID=UPI003466030B